MQRAMTSSMADCEAWTILLASARQRAHEHTRRCVRHGHRDVKALNASIKGSRCIPGVVFGDEPVEQEEERSICIESNSTK